MVAFRAATAGKALVHWTVADDLVSFGRGDRGHIVINLADEPVETTLGTGLADGRYRDRLASGTEAVVAGARMEVLLEPRSAAVFLAERVN